MTQRLSDAKSLLKTKDRVPEEVITFPEDADFEDGFKWVLDKLKNSNGNKAYFSMLAQWTIGYSIVATPEEAFAVIQKLWKSRKYQKLAMIALCEWLQNSGDQFRGKLTGMLGDFMDSQDLDTTNRLKLFYIRGVTPARLRELARRKFLNLQHKASSTSSTSKKVPEDKATLVGRVNRSMREFLNTSLDKACGALLYLENLLFQNIGPDEFLNQNWQRPELANHLLKKSIDQFNTVSYWVTSVCCAASEQADRVSVIEKFIALCDLCEQTRNYNGLMEILSGLNHNSCQRMKKTWASLDTEFLKRKAKLDRLMGNDKNFRRYRLRLRRHVRAGEAVVPYMAVHIRDLVSLATGADNLLDKKKNYINISKVLVSGKLVETIRALGRGVITVPPPTGKAVVFWLDLAHLDEDGLYEYSTLSEPLGYEQESLAAYISDTSNYSMESSTMDDDFTSDEETEESIESSGPALLAGVTMQQRRNSNSREPGDKPQRTRSASATVRRRRQPKYKINVTEDTAKAVNSFLNAFGDDSDSDSGSVDASSDS